MSAGLGKGNYKITDRYSANGMGLVLYYYVLIWDIFGFKFLALFRQRFRRFEFGLLLASISHRQYVLAELFPCAGLGFWLLPLLCLDASCFYFGAVV